MIKKRKKKLKDENSKVKVIEMKASEILYKTFILSSIWNYAFERKIFPLFNQYKKIGNEEDKNENIENKNKNKNKEMKISISL